jgi:hypothetical protein
MILDTIKHAMRAPLSTRRNGPMMRKPMNEGLKRYDALGNDVTETGDIEEARRLVVAHEAMLAELGLDAEATQEEIDAARAAKAKEFEYDQAKEVIAEYEARIAETTGAEPEPDPITPEDTQEYEEAKATVAAYDAAAAAPQPAVAEKPAEKSSWR